MAQFQKTPKIRNDYYLLCFTADDDTNIKYIWL